MACRRLPVIVVEVAPHDEQVVTIGGTGHDIVVISGRATLEGPGGEGEGGEGDYLAELNVGPRWREVSSCSVVLTLLDAPGGEATNCRWHQQEVEAGWYRIRLSAEIRAAGRRPLTLAYHLMAYGNLHRTG